MRLISILALLMLFALAASEVVVAQEETAPKKEVAAGEESAESEKASVEEEGSGEDSEEGEEKEATRISMSLKDADLVEVLRSFAKIGQFNLILDPKVSGKVTVELKDVPWDVALEQILKINGLGMEITKAAVHIEPSH